MQSTLSHQARSKTATPRSALVIDDHPLFCEALAITLKSVLHVPSVRMASDLAKGLSAIEVGALFDLILLDLNLPDVDGLDGLIRLRACAPDTPVIIVSSMADERLVEAAFRAGANAYVPKSSGREVFLKAFQEISQGRIFTPDGFAPSPANNNGANSSYDEQAVIERMALLTRQQTRILHLLCEGKLNKQIAYELDIAEATVKAHITAILRKLKVVSRTQAVVAAKSVQFSSILQNPAD